MRDVKDGLYAINYAMRYLGVQKQQLPETQALSDAVSHSLDNKTGEPFIVALSLAKYAKIAKKALQEAEPIRLSEKLVSAYRTGGLWEKPTITEGLQRPSPTNKRLFLKEIIQNPADFRESRIFEQNGIILNINKLLQDGSEASRAVATEFIATFSQDLKQALTHQTDKLIEKDQNPHAWHTNALIALVKSANAQISPSPFKFDEIIA